MSEKYRAFIQNIMKDIFLKERIITESSYLYDLFNSEDISKPEIRDFARQKMEELNAYLDYYAELDNEVKEFNKNEH